MPAGPRRADTVPSVSNRVGVYLCVYLCVRSFSAFQAVSRYLHLNEDLGQMEGGHFESRVTCCDRCQCSSDHCVCMHDCGVVRFSIFCIDCWNAKKMSWWTIYCWQGKREKRTQLGSCSYALYPWIMLMNAMISAWCWAFILLRWSLWSYKTTHFSIINIWNVKQMQLIRRHNSE